MPDHNDARGGRRKANSKRRLNAVIVYDDRPAGERGIQMLWQAAEGIKHDPGFHYHFWQMDLLHDQVSAKLAEIDLKSAHVLIISTSDPRQQLSPGVEGWMKDTLPYQAGDQLAVAVLFAESALGNGGKGPLFKYSNRLTSGLDGGALL